jgi:curli biogenesis system outer membrane secretion channel CsgG
MLKTTLLAALFTLAGIAAQAQTPAASAAAKPAAAASTAAADPEVKKSDAGICHDKTSNGYKQTKNYTAFKTMDECTKSGGRAPKK